MNEQFLLLIKTVLDQNGVKTDYNKLKQMLEKDPAKINTVMDMSATKTEINRFVKEFAPKLQSMFKDMGVNSNIKDIESSLKNVFKAYQRLSDSMDIIKVRAEGAGKGFNAYLKSLKPQVIKDYSGEIEKISSGFAKASESGKKFDLSKANVEMFKFKKSMQEANLEGKTFFQNMQDNFAKFSQWFLIGGIVAGTVRNIKDMVRNVKELDDQLLEL